ncbi:hypothetical protein ACCI51_18645 [Microbulbifer echini]|uniref:Uncharacterized protein n=1 Tax=Microbulbifer echini TaxID=1529067 RepID=A0ABV4NTE6_9GAMM
MGNWDGAIIRSVGWVLLFVVAYSFYEIGIPILTYPPQDFIAIFGLFATVYLAISVVGWLVIGLPFHWAVCNWSQPKFIYYLLAGVSVSLVVSVVGSIEAGIIFGLAATAQAIVFRYYVFKSKKI